MSVTTLRRLDRILRAIIAAALILSGIGLAVDGVRRPGLYPRYEEAFSGYTYPMFGFAMCMIVAGLGMLVHLAARPAPLDQDRPSHESALDPRDWLPPKSRLAIATDVVGALWSMAVGGCIWFFEAMVER